MTQRPNGSVGAAQSAPPKLANIAAPAALYARFLEELRQAGFAGDVHSDFASRLINATDNSVYQLLPQCVVAPRTSDDVALIARIAAGSDYRTLSFTPRGGGTGTNGQALTEGLVVDLSRHLNGILELNKAEGWVRVQPGVVLDQLNAFLKPHGLFFAPTVSPSSRATLGGMIATDACGKGSRIYGKTSGHIHSLSLVLSDGTRFESGPMSEAELLAAKARTDRVGEALRVVDDIVTQKRELIAETFPNIPRFLTGYNLAHVRQGEQPFCLNPLLAGSEGTLVFVTEARLRVLPLPQIKRLFAVSYATFDAALRGAEELVATDPSAIETVDDTIIELARKDAIWDRVGHLLESSHEGAVAAVNLVEFAGQDEAEVLAKVAHLDARLSAWPAPDSAPASHLICTTEEDAAALWELRKKGVGLLGNAAGSRRPIAFMEDTAVHPAQLADYIRELRALLDSYGLRYGMFGHVDAGCLHVRPALNLREESDERLLRELSDKVVALVRRYGGVMWSEHGKGFRSEYSPQFFGQELYADLCRIKRAFDPYNQLNPGKLATPSDSGAQLVSVDALKRGAYDRQITPAALDRFAETVNCNGNGACFDYAADSVMCPSSKVTRNRIHSPKGRASMMREWLRQSSQAGFDAAQALETRGRGGRQARGTDYDFSHEVYDAMDGCLSCKACATQCPIKVDVPRFKAEFLELYHRRYRRPLKDYFLSALEAVVVWMAWMPRLVNWVSRLSWVKALLRRQIGIVDAPQVSTTNLKRELARRGARILSEGELERLPPDGRSKAVFLVQDALHSYFEPRVMLAVYDLLVRLGFRPYVLPYRPSGKVLHVRGFLQRFEQLARDNTHFFRRYAALGIPLVGIDPAVTLAYRDEYVHAVREPLGFKVELLSDWLAMQPLALDPAPTTEASYVLMGHCTERTAAPGAQRAWQQIFSRFGAKLELRQAGCCGMCGMYGHDANHAEESRGIYDLSWGRHIPADANERQGFLAQGYSCRSQVKRFGSGALRHPAEALLEMLAPSSPASN